MRTCPHCSSEISDYVIKCVHCDTWLVATPPAMWEKEAKQVKEGKEPVTGEAAPPVAAPPPVASIPGGGDTLAPIMRIPDDLSDDEPGKADR